MEFKGIKGTVWKAPVSGAYININNADIKSLLGAAGGLAKTLFYVGGGALTLALSLIGVFALLNTKKDFMPWDILSKVRIAGDGLFSVPKRAFNGVCLTKEISLNCDSHQFTIPINWIKEFRYYYHAGKPDIIGFWGGIKKEGIKPYRTIGIELFDGSRYVGNLISPKSFSFLTPVGIQTVDIINLGNYYSVEGCTVSDIDHLKYNINEFLNINKRRLPDFIGQENFSKFFVNEK